MLRAGRHARSGGVGRSGDRLSALPDDLLHAVLSRLKARQAVQTCVLSTRWRHLWRSVPCLDIDQREFHTAGAPPPHPIFELQRFKNFTHILLSRHDVAHLEEFRLQVSYDIRKHADSWVRRGISQDDTWPCRLRRLHLCNVILDDYFARHVRLRCPSLQELDLARCSYMLSEVTAITSSSLRKFTVSECSRSFGSFGLILEAPALASLCLVGNIYSIVDKDMPRSLPSLVDASITLPVFNEFGDNIYISQDNSGTQMHLLCMLANVTSLKLSGFGVVPDDCLGLDFPRFMNLRTLSLEKCDLCDNFILLKHFLRNSPNLTKLTLCCCKLSDPEHRDELMGNNMPSYCSQDLGDVQYENLGLTEIMFYRDDNVHLLVNFMSGLSRNLPNNTVEFIEVDY